MNNERLTRFVILLLGTVGFLSQASDPVATLPSDMPAELTPVTAGYDYDKREVMIPMRDGVKLKTFILVPKTAKAAPMLLTRTPYNAADRIDRMPSPKLASVVPQMDDTAVAAGYVIVFQDVRGKYGSEGDYVTWAVLSSAR